MTTSPNFLYEFGAYRLNLTEALLLRSGVPVALSPKTFEVLTLLVRRAGTLVDRETLMRELWRDSFVEDANIARHIWTLRQAFGDDHYIETIPKRGYRFTAPVRSLQGTPGDPPPADARAREAYLRANQLSQRPPDHPRALALYQEAVTADPAFAPAWAQMGRLYRVMGKYQDDGSISNRLAEEALERALTLDPESTLAHTQYALLEADLGRGLDAMTRLVAKALARRGDPALLAGLVHACRFAGLLDASIAAHRRAIELDPLIATSVLQSYWMAGNVPLALAESAKLSGGSLRPMVLALAGREAEAITYLREQEAKLPYPRMRLFSAALRALLEGDRAAALTAIDKLLPTTRTDPEGLYFLARYLARLGEIDRANDVLASAVFGGFTANRMMSWDPWLDALRATASFQAVQAQADARYAVAVKQFMRGGGEEILGPGSAA